MKKILNLKKKLIYFISESDVTGQPLEAPFDEMDNLKLEDLSLSDEKCSKLEKDVRHPVSMSTAL